MRNLKRALSLALASVMLVGMMVVGTSAASYPDVDDKDHVEAIEVLSAVGVIVGDNGNFRPDDNVSRNEMAVIMAKLILGTYEADSYVGSHPFTDVPDWASKYVAACYNAGIIAGRGEGIYDGSSTVTAVEAAAMMLRALGYEDLSKGSTSWDQPVAAKANEVNLFEGLSGNSQTPMDRNSVAQLALNTLEATMVITERSGYDIDIPGTVTITGKLTYKDREDPADRNYDQDNDGKLQLCEYLYKGKLEKKVTTDETTVDDAFGRPAIKWEYNSKDVITVVEDADATYTEEVEYGDIYKDLGLSGASKPASLVVDGGTPSDISLTKTSKTALGGNGVLVQAYKDDEGNVTVTVVKTYLAQVSGDYDEKDEELSISVISPGLSLSSANSTLSLDDFANLASFKDEEYVLITVADGEVKTIVPAEVVTATVASYTKKGGNHEDVTFDGETHKYSDRFEDQGYLNSDYTIDEESVFILDTYGYVIGLDEVSGSDDYVFIKEFDNKGEFSGSYIADAYFPDGTNKTITLDKINDYKITGTATTGDPDTTTVTANAATYSGWYTYTVKSDKYSLTKVDSKTDAAWEDVDQSATVTENGKVAVVYRDDGAGKATNSTVLVLKDGSKITTYTGIKNFPTIKTESHDGTWSWVAEKDGYVKYMFVDVGDASVKGATSNSGDKVFILATDCKEKNDSKDGDPYYVYDAIVNGKKTTVNATANDLNVGLYDDVVYNEDGYLDVAASDDADDGSDYVIKAVSGKTVTHSGDVVVFNSVAELILADDCKIYVIDGDGPNYKDVTNVASGKALADKYKDKAITGKIFAVLNDKDYVTDLYVRVTGTVGRATVSATATSGLGNNNVVGTNDPLTAAQKLTASLDGADATTYAWEMASSNSTNDADWGTATGTANAQDYVPTVTSAFDKWFRCKITYTDPVDGSTTVKTNTIHVVVKDRATAPTKAEFGKTGSLVQDTGTGAALTGIADSDEIVMKLTYATSTVKSVAVSAASDCKGAAESRVTVSSSGSEVKVYTAGAAEAAAKSIVTVTVVMQEADKLDKEVTYTFTLDA